MKKIKVLFFSHLFYPTNIVSATRATKFVEYLPENIETIIFSASSKKNKKLKLKKHIIIVSKCKLLKLKSNIASNPESLTFKMKIKLFIRDIFFIPDKYIWWYLIKIPYFYSIIRKNKIDIMVATGDPFSTFIVVYLLNKITKIPFI